MKFQCEHKYNVIVLILKYSFRTFELLMFEIQKSRLKQCFVAEGIEENSPTEREVQLKRCPT